MKSVPVVDEAKPESLVRVLARREIEARCADSLLPQFDRGRARLVNQLFGLGDQLSDLSQCPLGLSGHGLKSWLAARKSEQPAGTLAKRAKLAARFNNQERFGWHSPARRIAAFTAADWQPN